MWARQDEPEPWVVPGLPVDSALCDGQAAHPHSSLRGDSGVTGLRVRTRCRTPPTRHANRHRSPAEAGQSRNAPSVRPGCARGKGPVRRARAPYPGLGLEPEAGRGPPHPQRPPTAERGPRRASPPSAAGSGGRSSGPRATRDCGLDQFRYRSRASPRTRGRVVPGPRRRRLRPPDLRRETVGREGRHRPRIPDCDEQP